MAKLTSMFVAAVLWAGAGSAFAQVTASPSSFNFPSVAVNIEAGSPQIVLTNNGSNSANLSGITFSIPQYGINLGLVQQPIKPHATATFVFVFMASQPGTYNGTISFNFTTQSPVVINVTASAFATTAATSLSTTSINFGSVAFGSSSTQSVTVTNTGGPDSVTLKTVTTYYQPFVATGFTKAVTLTPGQSITVQVSFSPLILGSTTGTVTFCYDVVPCNAADLTGTGTVPAQLAITNYPTLPAATQGAAYQATVTGSGGTPPYSFAVAAGSRIPPGLTLSTATGLISGTLPSNAVLGNHTFTLQLTDSGQPPLQATAPLTLPVDKPTGANCNVIDVDVPNTSTPIVDLMDLGTGTYLNEEGGLYPNGSNTDPTGHDADGVAFAQGIGPLDQYGNPDPSGLLAMVSIGESASQEPFTEFITMANADPEKNPQLVLANGAQGGATANAWTLTSSGYWTEVLNYILPQAGVTADQVVAAWVDDVNSTQQTFPQDAQTIQGDMETISQILLQNFHNIKLAYFSTLNYSGYSTGIDSTVPEPKSYESAFGVKWAIQDQINSVCCNYNSNNGTVTAPWMGWSFYYWGNGLIPRSDGVTWSCQDLQSDGLHPAAIAGHVKIASYLLNFFKTNDTTAPWFLAPGARFKH